MEHWTAKVESGGSHVVNLGEGQVLHITQACLGVFRNNAKDNVCLLVKFSGEEGAEESIMGTLHTKRHPHALLNLMFCRDIEISHNWPKGCVYYYGYIAKHPTYEPDGSEDVFEQDLDLDDCSEISASDEDYNLSSEDDSTEICYSPTSQQYRESLRIESASKSPGTSKKAKGKKKRKAKEDTTVVITRKKTGKKAKGKKKLKLKE